MSRIRSTGSLWHALEHHASELAPMVGVLALGYALELEPRGFKLRQHKEGPRSFSLTGPDGREYHFRPTAGNTKIAVYDRWNHGYDPAHRVALLDSRVDAIRFVDRLSATGAAVAA